MCGRYANNAEMKELRRKFPFLSDDYFDIHGYKTRSEIFPGTPIMAINKHHEAEDIWWTIRGESWDGKMFDVINSKAENVMKTKMFKDAFLTDRVLIPATSLYEWQTQTDKSKLKYEIWFDDPVFAFAGIARDSEIKGETKRCGVIMTTEPNDIFAEIHNVKKRQAIVIREADYEKWLDPGTPYDQLKPLLVALPEQETHFKLAV